jgi:protein dithiol oxidoreductase (disulfide-forming)
MRITRFAASAAVVLASAFFAGATARAQVVVGTGWESGKHYFPIDPPVATASGDKIEVTEVFSYGCPACNFAYPQIAKLRKTLPPNAVMNYVPAAFNAAEDWPMFQRAYLAAKALGVADTAHEAMFDAVWKSGDLAIMDKATNQPKKPLPSIEDAAAFYAKYGVKAEEFVATANSFTINTRMKQADAFIKASGVDQTPTLIVNGKYRLTVTSAGGWDKVEQLVQFLIRKESGGK